MRALAIPFCLLASLPSFAAGVGQVDAAVNVYNGAIARGFSGMTDSIQANTNRSLVEIQYLAAYKMKVSKEPRCNAYVDLTLAASRSTVYTPAALAASRERSHQSVMRGVQAGCYVKMTPLEAMPYSLRVFWESRHAKLSTAPACAPYVRQSIKIAFAEKATENARQLALSELYVDASQRGCIAP